MRVTISMDGRPWLQLNTLSFMAHHGPTGGCLLFFFCSSVSVVLLTPQESPGVSTRCTPILRIGDQVLTFDVFWPKHLQEVRSTVYIHVQSI